MRESERKGEKQKVSYAKVNIIWLVLNRVHTRKCTTSRRADGGDGGVGVAHQNPSAPARCVLRPFFFPLAQLCVATL